MKKYFGTDGIRFIYDETTLDLIAKVSQALNLFPQKEIIIGNDTRFSSNEIVSCLCNNIKNKKISYCGVISTPAISFLSKKHNAIGIMITASHNPKEYNGLKFFLNGLKLNQKQQEKFEKAIDKENSNYNKKTYLPTINHNYRKEYLNFLKSWIIPTNFPIAFDVGHGAISSYIKEISDYINSHCLVINNNPDGYNINQNSGALYPHLLQKEMKQQNISYGFSFDGDGDRLIFMDQNNIYSGDDIVYLFANYLTIKKKKIILTPYSNPSLVEYLHKKGFKTEIVDVGDTNILNALTKQKLSLGGEDSGHILLPDFIPSGDGLFNAIMIIRIIQVCGLRSFISFPHQPSKLTSIELKDKDLLSNPLLINRKLYFEKLYGKKLYINFRKSGTENKIRIFLSHPSVSVLNSVYNRLISDLKILDSKIITNSIDNIFIDAKSVIEDNVTMIGNTHIINSNIKKGTTITSSFIEDSSIGENCSIGPYAHIRNNSQINRNSRIGNFVEIKKSVLNNNTKVAHLTYIGDTISGKNVNYGCGCVTVNYDGKQKHQTRIGDDVFIGCNTNLIAPISISDNAFIAAGSTITSSLDNHDFAIARARQTTKKQGAKKYQLGKEK